MTPSLRLLALIVQDDWNLLAAVLSHGEHGSHLSTDERGSEDQINGDGANPLPGLDSFSNAFLG